MAINLAEKYSAQVDEKFALASKTAGAFNNDYDFVGVNVVHVYSIPTVEMQDYTKQGANRYGTPSELQDTIQTLTLTQDKSFTFTIDRGNNDDQMMTKEAGRALDRQIREQIIPMLDKYRLAKMVAGAGTTATATAPTKSNAYELFLKGNEALGDNAVPETGRIAFVSYAFYNFLKQDPSFVKQSESGQQISFTGVVGTVDGTAIIPVPASYLPENVYLIMTHSVALVAPVKLTDYKIHDNPPGINGWLVEGRVRHDAFVLSNKAKAIYVQAKA